MEAVGRPLLTSRCGRPPAGRGVRGGHARTWTLLAIVVGLVLSLAWPIAAMPEPLTLTVYTAVADGVVHWFPATLIVASGTPLTLVLVNHLETLHWFILTGTGVNVPVPGRSARTAQVTVEQPGTYPFFDPHDPDVVGGVLIVKEPDSTP